MKPLSSPPRGLLRAAHAAGLLFIVLPLVDYFANVLPLRLDARWRYGAVGLLSNYLLTPVLGALVIGLVAGFARQRRILLVVAWASAVVGVCVVAGQAIFGLDVLQLRPAVPLATRHMFTVGAAKASFKLTFMGLWLIGFGVAAMREARSLKRARGQADDSGLIIRRRDAAGAAAPD